jgi:hypothetical protein
MGLRHPKGWDGCQTNQKGKPAERQGRKVMDLRRSEMLKGIFEARVARLLKRQTCRKAGAQSYGPKAFQ